MQLQDRQLFTSVRNPPGLVSCYQQRKLRSPEKFSMTICAAAICKKDDKDIILTISDRMLTTSDNYAQFEGGTSKVYGFGKSNTLTLAAGSIERHLPIAYKTHELVDQGASKVEEIVTNYTRLFKDARKVSAEATYLAGMSISRDDLMNENLLYKIDRHELRLQTIIAGVDDSGAHIYVVLDPGEMLCKDQTGFAAVGIGQSNFDSAMLAMRFSRWDSWLKALLMLYHAKKQAENAPGVGKLTDMHIIADGTAKKVDGSLLYALEQHYKYFDKQFHNAWNDTIQRMSNDERITGNKETPEKTAHEGGAAASEKV